MRKIGGDREGSAPTHSEEEDLCAYDVVDVGPGGDGEKRRAVEGAAHAEVARRARGNHPFSCNY